MTGHQLHLILNHLPLFGSLFAFILLVVGLARRSPELIKAGLITLFVTSLLTVPTYVSGDGAWEAVDQKPNTNGDIMMNHAQLAEYSLYLMLPLGALAFAGIFLLNRAHSKRRLFIIAVTAATFAVVVLMGVVSHLGGQIIRPDLRKPGTENAAPAK